MYLEEHLVIEIYLFIHPFGSLCLEEETRLIDFINESSEKINLQILPFVNMTTTTSIMRKYGWDKKDLDSRNTFLNHSYSAALDYKAAQQQGKKYARIFLLKLQTAIICHKTPYSQQLAETLFAETGGDIDMFREDRQSALVKEKFWQDQQTARDLHIQHQTSAVIYNFYREEEYGILLQGGDALRTIPSLCQNARIFSSSKRLKRANERVHVEMPRLRLL
jgi:predicted DsbA family dithiol-disulfide isomerase